MGLAIGINFLRKGSKCISHTRQPFAAAPKFETINTSALQVCPNFLKRGLRDVFELENPATYINNTNVLHYASKAEPFRQVGGHGCRVYTKDGVLLGQCSYRDRIVGHSAENAVFPASWIDPKTNFPKSSLYVDMISTEAAGERIGNGREIMKRLYLQSIENGHEGRISLQTAYGSEGFYEKLGFENGQDVIEDWKRELKNLKCCRDWGTLISTRCKTMEELDIAIAKLEEELATHIPCRGQGFLYFTPTEKNLAKLFAK